MKFILLLPIFIYLALMAVNLDLLQDFQTVNLFGVALITGPIIMFSSFFIVIYATLIYITYSGVNSLQARKLAKKEREIVELKSELYNNQKDLLATMQENFTEKFQTFKNDNDRKFETLIRYNEYTLEKVLEETNGSFRKYREETKKLFANTKGVDKRIFEKLKVWK